MSVLELALQRNKYKHLSDDEWRWFLQQTEGRERTADKLPTFAATEDWWYPVRLSCEQCSSELAARYKASLVSGEKAADLTGGYGVDTYFLSAHFAHMDYVEQNAELCRIAAHNFADKPISIHNTSAEDFLKNAGRYDLIYLDPARRNSHGGKVFRLEDCTPNVVDLLPDLQAHSQRIMLKLSPMLDLTQAVNALSSVTWDIYVVAIKNEVKEILLLSGGSGRITAIDLEKKDQVFVFTREEEQKSTLNSQFSILNYPFSILNSPFSILNYLYEPNVAILKAGAYKLIAERFGLCKLDVNTHLYSAEKYVENFPGRVWRIIEHQEISHANVLTRNYPLTPDQLKKKLHLRDGGDVYVIGCRVAGRSTLFYAERV